LTTTSRTMLHHDDLLLRTWRSIAHSIALVTNKAEKVVAESNRDAVKELNEATMGFLRHYVEWGRLISYLEAKLEGKAAELEFMQHFVQSHPSMGRKRKRAETDSKVATDDKPATGTAIPPAPLD
jgi:hypothetical protein